MLCGRWGWTDVNTERILQSGVHVSGVQTLSRVRLFATPWTAARLASLLKLMSIDAIQPSHPLLSPSPPTFNPSQHQGPFQ